jgi:predicted acetyltransferase
MLHRVETLLATRAEKSIIQRLMELYQYDFSEFNGTDIDAHGMYGYDYLDNYWTQKEHYPFLVRIEQQLAGFVLVNNYVCITGNTRSIAEFFVMRKYRRYGVGRLVACTIFDQLPGKWEVRQIQENIIAQAFWRAVIQQYTHGRSGV